MQRWYLVMVFNPVTRPDPTRPGRRLLWNKSSTTAW